MVSQRAAILVVSAAALGACSGAGLGDPCSQSAECRSGLQCFGGVCTAQCERPFDCGDGFLCEAGECQMVMSDAGDPCERELDCGPGQSCRLQDADGDGDGFLAATCELDVPGAGTGTTCVSDDECRGGICTLGRCSQLCQQDADCPLDLACVQIPRPLATGDASFFGCTQGDGVLRTPVPLDLPFQEITIPVPSHARSFTVVSQVPAGQQVGLARLIGPNGAVLYARPFSPEEYLENPIRYEPDFEVSTALVPNTTEVELEVGVYRAEVSSLLPVGGVGTAVPEVEILYKLDDSQMLDLHLYFLNLADHPCEASFGGPLDAATAQNRAELQEVFLPQLRDIFAAADIEIGAITYQDVLDRPDLDGLAQGLVGELVRIADGRRGLHLFFVRGIEPVGIQALATGTPGAPISANTPASGIALSADTLCYRSWSDLARRSAYAMGQQMGLFDSVAPDGVLDPIADTDDSPTNLMYFGEFGGTAVSEGQAEVLHNWPGLR